MNDPIVPRSDNPPAEEPIPLEPVPLEPVSDRAPPVSIEPPADAAEPPIELEPVGAPGYDGRAVAISPTGRITFTTASGQRGQLHLHAASSAACEPAESL